MPAIVLVGAQWGDEGKGKATDLLGSRVDYVVKFNGGNNAGHTVVIGDEKYALHLLPSGILTPTCIPVIGNGVVVDLEVLFREIDDLRDQKHLRGQSLGMQRLAHFFEDQPLMRRMLVDDDKTVLGLRHDIILVQLGAGSPQRKALRRLFARRSCRLLPALRLRFGTRRRRHQPVEGCLRPLGKA